MIQKKVSSRCSNQGMFEKHKGDYERALKNSGYQTNLVYVKGQQQGGKRKRQRWPRIFWFNPPFNLKVKTRIGEQFLKLVEKNFPKGSRWHKFFNKHTLKLSYSCTKNIASHINSHNKKVLSKSQHPYPEQEGCNCRKDPCPVDGHCQTKGLVYIGALTSGQKNWTYFGSTANTFKERYSGHKQDLENDKRNGTALSNKVWELKKSNTPYTLSWKIAHRCHPLTAGMPTCDVCLTEKTRILLGHKGPQPTIPGNSTLLNRRSELYAKCRHRTKFILRHCP